MSDENQDINKDNNLRFKFRDLEFELKGSQDYIKNAFSWLMDFIDQQNIFEEFDLEEDLEIIDEDSIIYDEEVQKDMEKKPLDVFLKDYDVDHNQKKVISIALYMMRVLKKDEFRARDINNILKANKLTPIVSITTHINRLRNKQLISVVSTKGSEAVYTIYKDNIENAENFAKKGESS
ncbi:MAG: hypothetical protein JSV62_02545 [Promethearchaeota archaeon]|nr:MAG: hypothetical protein JSV62_02545 [Candidatus Lokiarchaeota archaeon]